MNKNLIDNKVPCVGGVDKIRIVHDNYFMLHFYSGQNIMLRQHTCNSYSIKFIIRHRFASYKLYIKYIRWAEMCF